MMPNVLGAACRVRTCPRKAIQGTGYCELHYKERYRDNRLPSHKRGYNARWNKLRKAKRQANPLCERCQAKGITRIAELVHHITPLDKGGELLAWDNLMSLCRNCHDEIHMELNNR